MFKPHIEKCLSGFHFQVKKQNRCHLNNGTEPDKSCHHYKTQALKVQNMKLIALLGQNSVPKKKKNQKFKTENATRVSSADRSGETRGRPFRSELPSPIGRATGRASTRARGFLAYTSRRPLAGVGLSCDSDHAP